MCSSTPRFSYRGSKTAICACPAGTTPCRRGRAVQGCTGVGYGDWVGGAGVYPGTQPAARGEVQIQRSGPRRPCKGRSGWYLELGRPARPGTTPAGPGRSPAVPSLYLPFPPRKAASWPITARFHDILLKVSQNGQVSTKYVEKACHSPYIQNGVRKSPLEIPRFPYSTAFSHKELMGCFDPH